MGNPDVVVYNPQEHSDVLPSLVELMSACIQNDYTLMTFLPPLDHARMLEWWQKQASDPNRTIFLLFDKETETCKEELAGYVALYMPWSQTGPFRGHVEKLTVSPRFRRRNIARKLLLRLEAEAAKEGRWLLMLDTGEGSAAELMYPKLGYTRMGRIPDYGYSPKDGNLQSEVFFYKDLRSSK